MPAEHRPLGPRLQRLPARDPGGLGAQPEWAIWGPRNQRPEGTHVGVERANPAEIRSSHTLPPGRCRRRKRRRRRQDRPRLGEEETLSGSASGQPQPGRQVRKVGIKNSCTGRRAGWGRGWITGRANADCRQRPFYFRPVRRRFRSKRQRAYILPTLLFPVPPCETLRQHGVPWHSAPSLGEHKIAWQGHQWTVDRRPAQSLRSVWVSGVLLLMSKERHQPF